MSGKTFVIGAVVLGASAAIAQAAPVSPFSYSYEGDALPDAVATNPVWNKVLDSNNGTGNTSATVSNGILTVYTASAADYLDYRLDGGAGTAWDPTGAGSTVEIRVKTDFNAPDSSGWAGDIEIGTGQRAWMIMVGEQWLTDRLGGGDYRFTQNDGFHVFRFTVGDEANGPLNLYIDDSSTIAHSWAGVSSTANRLDFGDLTASTEGGQVEWDYIRWTNGGAFAPPVPEPALLSVMALGALPLMRKRRQA